MTAFDPRSIARNLLRETGTGALSSLTPGGGAPYGSLVATATAQDGAPLFLLSGLALHTRNILADPRAALLLATADAGDPLQSPRLSLGGTLTPSEAAADRRRYLARHPDAEAYAGFKDFAVYKLTISTVHLVAGFGRIADLAPDELLTDLAAAAALVAAETDILSHLNSDHAATLKLYATRLCNEPDTQDWQAIGCDTDGLDIRSKAKVRRINFLQRTTSPDGVRLQLKTLAEKARQTAIE